MADSLCLPLFFSPILAADGVHTIKEKYLLVNSFIDTYINRRVLSGRSVNQSTIRRPIFDIIKKIRNINVEELIDVVNDELFKYDSNESTILMNVGLSQSYMHYFYARVLYALNISDDFRYLLRTKKQTSYVLTPLFTDDEWKLHELGGKSNVSPWSIFNYCICRRNDARNMPDEIGQRVEWFIEKDYLPELKPYEINLCDLIEKRIDALNKIAGEIWPIKMKVSLDGVVEKRDFV